MQRTKKDLATRDADAVVDSTRLPGDLKLIVLQREGYSKNELSKPYLYLYRVILKNELLLKFQNNAFVSMPNATTNI
jgi:hypothetical protein